MDNEIPIGFDARKTWFSFSEFWTEKRRAAHLYRSGLRTVYSTDNWSWPSVFSNYTGGVDQYLTEYDRLVLDGPEVGDRWIGPNNPLWEDLNELTSTLEIRKHVTKRPYALIAVTCFRDQVAKDNDLGPYFEPTVPPEPGPEWEFLGYDVSDGSFTSGLSNCGLKDDERTQEVRDKWGAMLNEKHLFTAYNDADNYRAWIDGLVKEHAPFYTYGLYMIREVHD